MSTITAYASQRNIAHADTGSFGPYLQQQTQQRSHIIPTWTTERVEKYAFNTGASTSLAATGYALWNGFGLGALATGTIGIGVLGFLVGGLARIGYNVLKHYKIL